jgi:hypothetical protein
VTDKGSLFTLRDLGPTLIPLRTSHSPARFHFHTLILTPRTNLHLYTTQRLISFALIALTKPSRHLQIRIPGKSKLARTATRALFVSALPSRATGPIQGHRAHTCGLEVAFPALSGEPRTKIYFVCAQLHHDPEPTRNFRGSKQSQNTYRDFKATPSRIPISTT